MTSLPHGDPQEERDGQQRRMPRQSLPPPVRRRQERNGVKGQKQQGSAVQPTATIAGRRGCQVPTGRAGRRSTADNGGEVGSGTPTLPAAHLMQAKK